MNTHSPRNGHQAVADLPGATPTLRIASWLPRLWQPAAHTTRSNDHVTAHPVPRQRNPQGA